jgi:hypothetical protein
MGRCQSSCGELLFWALAAQGSSAVRRRERGTARERALRGRMDTIKISCELLGRGESTEVRFSAGHPAARYSSTLNR